MGYCAFTAAAAGFSYWAPDFLLTRYSELTVKTANERFGLVLFAGGAIGTVVGGRFANRALRNQRVAPDAPYDSPANKLAVNGLLRVCAIGMTVAAPLAALGFLMPGPNAFFAISFVVDIGLFASTSPVNAAFLRSVPIERRASAMAASIFSIHLFGDLWSAAALGLLRDALSPTLAMMALPVTFGLSAYLWWPRRREALPTTR
jgi:hypothetical protein